MSEKTVAQLVNETARANANGAQPAFARPPAGDWYAQDGLSKRELLAAMAMQGFCAHHDIGSDLSDSEIADIAVKHADALLKALAK